MKEKDKPEELDIEPISDTRLLSIFITSAMETAGCMMNKPKTHAEAERLFFENVIDAIEDLCFYEKESWLLSRARTPVAQLALVARDVAIKLYLEADAYSDE